MNSARRLSAVVQFLSAQAIRNALHIDGAMQPDPVVIPPSAKSRRWTTAGRSPMPLMTRRRSTRFRRPVEHGVLAGIIANDGVFDRNRDPVVDEPADRVERLLAVGSEAVLGFQVDDERHAGGVGDLAHADFASARIARIAAGQHHRGGEGMAAQDAGLIDGAAERWAEARNRPPRGREVGQPVEERFVLGERDVVEERVSTVEEARDAAVGDVPGDLFGRIEIEAAVAVGLARQAAGRRKRPTGLRESECRESRQKPFPGCWSVVEFYPCCLCCPWRGWAVLSVFSVAWLAVPLVSGRRLPRLRLRIAHPPRPVRCRHVTVVRFGRCQRSVRQAEVRPITPRARNTRITRWSPC